ncbi:hypothetical protein [Arthrobacter sp. CAN_C5]|uniref:hypothetical protein n=1 Tax=Arthrobacter sp. CAN_C5 TaxID=2760706 RepID=UPI001AE0FC25|nr:hypothetical protein [Arthrobacter sp. CAN_C5]MBP2216068.1 hypothetical protein [Arthrobacter sp. CAN_C5]
MSRLTVGNVIKVALALIFFIFVAFYVLIIGIGAKNKRVLLEGAIYAAVFIVAFSVPGDGPLSTMSGLVGLAVMGVSAVRSYGLRDLWLRKRVREQQLGAPVGPHEHVHPAPQYRPEAVPAPRSWDELSAALAWVSSSAKQNKHRLPPDAYVTVLETCQTLDAVIDAERRQPSGDAGFEYELEAVVREYLPNVLQGYLAIPSGLVENRQPNGKTSNEELVEQLLLLYGQAEALHSNRHSQTSANLTSTGNFLRERFGHHRRDGFDFGIK